MPRPCTTPCSPAFLSLPGVPSQGPGVVPGATSPGHSRQRSGPLQFCGCPPAWAHWREYSAKVAHGQVGQRHRSRVQAATYTPASTSPWHGAKAGPSSVLRQTPSWETGRRLCPPWGSCGDPTLQPLPGQGAPSPEVPSSLALHPLIRLSTHLSFHRSVCPSRPPPSWPAVHLRPPHPSQPLTPCHARCGVGLVTHDPGPPTPTGLQDTPAQEGCRPHPAEKGWRRGLPPSPLGSPSGVSTDLLMPTLLQPPPLISSRASFTAAGFRSFRGSWSL